MTKADFQDRGGDDVFVHWEAIQTDERWPKLEKDMKVLPDVLFIFLSRLLLLSYFAFLNVLPIPPFPVKSSSPALRTAAWASELELGGSLILDGSIHSVVA